MKRLSAGFWDHLLVAKWLNWKVFPPEQAACQDRSIDA